MKMLKLFVFIIINAISVNASALIITDLISFNQKLENGSSYEFEFDFTKQGYNPLTDAIVAISFSYDFSEIIDDGHDPEDMNTWETVLLASHLFDGRSYYTDIQPGVIGERLSWNNQAQQCQYYAYDYEGGNDICTHNIDLNGKARETLIAYTDNLWLNNVSLSLEVERVQIPEPSPLILLACGLFALGWRFYFYADKIQ